MKNLIRKSILNLQPYSSARDEFTGSAKVFLDANENPFGVLNRYPDPNQKELKERLSEIKGIDSKHIFIGNGSDEVIDLAFRIFCEPGVDKVLTFSPTYGMYDVSAAINDIDLIKIPLNDAFQIDLKSTAAYLDDPNLKMIFICSPNNPTGNLIEGDSINWILEKFKGIVIVDEAYIDFATTKSNLQKIKASNDRLIVIQTLSKAWGLAAARIGMAYACEEIITLFNKVKPPYNVSKLNQNAALTALNDVDEFNTNVRKILAQRNTLQKELSKLDFVKNIYPSDTNFLLIEVENAEAIYQRLVDREIVVRNRNSVVAGCLRITIGSPEENERLLEEMMSCISLLDEN